MDSTTENYAITEKLAENKSTLVCRGYRRADGEPVVLKILRPTASTGEAQLRLEHEFSATSKLNLPGVAKSLALEHHRTGLTLVFRDDGGQSLDRILERGPLPSTAFLDVAIALANTVGSLHEHQLIHRNIQPSHVIINLATKQVSLIGFGWSDEFTGRNGPALPPLALQGTLAYISPEQTGRMNRPVDHRTDFYSLGVTFYQMLTGHPPFEERDALGLAYSHIAKTPASPCERNPDVPAMISRIVMKLMAKMADDRYQSARGLQRDLEKCLHALRNAGAVGQFELGLEDFSGQLRSPKKLYSRERDVARLLDAFARSHAGKRQLLLVTGYSGIGKTSLVHEAQRLMADERGNFIEGKFDQFQCHVPYSGWIQAFAGLVNYILMESAEHLAAWRNTILASVGGVGRLLTDVIPNLELILGPQPDVLSLGPTESHHRFHYVLLKFISAIATSGHPLVVFLDDLQWIDAASLDLLQILASSKEASNSLLIGAYRDNEVGPLHPLTRTVKALREEQVWIEEITLGNLTESTANHLIADTLQRDGRQTKHLSKLIYPMTGGNPFFLLQILKSMVDRQAIVSDVQSGQWKWDIDRIKALELSSDVAALMLGRLKQLPAETQQTLSLAACIGYRFDVHTLSIVTGQSGEIIAERLQPAQRDGLIVLLAEAWHFVHDRIQQAAYTLIPDKERSAQHLKIGRLLQTNTPEPMPTETIFEIVGQLNRGVLLITSQEERESLAVLNLTAGRRAKGSMAYVSALSCLTAGRALLTDDCWERRHELAYALEINSAECEFLTGARDSAEQRLMGILEHTADTVERAGVACLLVDLYTTLGQSSRAIAAGLDFLRRLGIECQPNPSEEEVRGEYERLKATLRTYTRSELLELPPMTNPSKLATVEVLTKIWPPALFSEANLASLIICKAVSLSLEWGNCDASCFAYALLGRIAGAHFGDYKDGHQFGQLGYELVERRGLKRFEARTYLCFANSVLPWIEHVRACRDLQQRAFEAANRAGDLLYGAFACNSRITDLLFAGEPLTQVQGEAEKGLAFAERASFGLVVDSIAAQLALVRSLRGLTSIVGGFDDGEFNESRTECHFSSNPALALAACRYWIRKLQARYIAGDYAAALEAALKAQQLLWTAPLAFEEADYHFFGAMAQAASCGNDACDQRRQQVVALTAHHKQLEIWAENCPANFENRATLVGAEIARLEGRVLDAEHLYERAIATSGKNGFVHTEAIAYEVAARFYRERGFEKIARTYLTEAVASYSRWGALGKVRQLEENHPWLAPRNQQQAMNLTERLDIESLAKAQQSISSKIEMDTLLEEAMHIVIENAGAQNGLLLTEDDGGALHIIARGGTGAAENKVPLPIGIDQSDLVAGSVVRYVARTKESVVLNDAANEGDFMDDPFIKRERTKSLVCAPLLNLGRLIGVLYLENNLATHLFTPERVQLLKMLLAQAAVALENARVYEALRESEAKYRRIVDTANEGIWLLGADGRTAFVNERMAAMLGYSPEEMVGRRPVEFMPEEDLPDYFERMAQRKKGLPENFECRYRCKDGGSISTLSAAAPIFDDKGVYQGAFAMFTNITERKRAEEALKASEAKFMDLYDNAPDMYMSVNARTASIDECNQTGANILGVPKCEIVGRSVFAIYHPDCRDEAEGTFNEFLDKGEIHDRDLALQRHDGSKLDVSVNVSAVRGEDGTILFGRSTLRDITERKQAEEAVRTLSKAIEQSPVSIVITDPAGTIEFANRKTSETTGYTCEEVVGKNSRIFKSGETPTEEYRQLWSTIKAGGVWRGELRNRKKNGELFWESTTIAPVRNATGVISHFVAVKEDVTEKKALEEQLRQTQKMEAVGQLAGGVAHDFNNMLGVIIGSAEMALELTTDESPLRQNIEQIMMAADRSADIARKLLTFARKQTIQPKIIDLNKRIEGMLKLLRRLVGEDIELRWTPGKDVLPVRMDPTQVDQILANLCVNAKDAIAGVGKITIKTCQAACDRLDLKEVCLSNQNGFPTDNHVMLAVSDNGCGMDKGTLDRIFEPFFTTKGLGKGTGLGLATVYGIVKQNDGLIKVESEPGAGSTFRIFLPGQAVKPEESLTDNPAAPIPRGHETILLVEDDSAILEVVKRMLRDLGYTVWATPSPRAAIGMVGENPQQFALLVTDVVMPEMSGLDLMKDLTSRFPELQCLFMSGYTGDVVANRGVVGEEFHLIQKPFSKKDLAVAVRAALDGKW